MMNRGALLTWGSLAASAAFVVAAQFKKPPAQGDARPAPAPAAINLADVPMADLPAGTKGLHLTDQGGAPEATGTAGPAPHRYASFANGEFSYARSPSDDDRSRGVASMRPLRVRYLGRTTAGVYGFTSTSIGAYRYLWCSDPCTVMQAGFAGGGSSYRTEFDARYPSVLHDVYLDASAGRLDFALDRASP